MPQQTFTLHMPLPRLPVIITRLTAYLVQEQYEFLQTFYDTTHTAFDIFKQQQPIVCLTLRSVEDNDPASTPAALVSTHALTADAVALVQYLLQGEADQTSL
jgi:hypothetical protein